MIVIEMGGRDVACAMIVHAHACVMVVVMVVVAVVVVVVVVVVHIIVVRTMVVDHVVHIKKKRLSLPFRPPKHPRKRALKTP